MPISPPIRCSAIGCRPPRTSPSPCGSCWPPSWAPSASAQVRLWEDPTLYVDYRGETGMSALVEITRVYHFSAAHRLVNPALSEEENAALYGPCARAHGHNYYLEVTLAGSPDPRTGMAVDLGPVDARRPARRAGRRRSRDAGAGPRPGRGDHHGRGPGPRVLGHAGARELPAGTLTRVAVHETAKNQFEYRGDRA